MTETQGRISIVVPVYLGAETLAPLVERLVTVFENLGQELEILLVNGEDHYAAPGEMDWLASNEGRLDDVVLALNIDGAGYKRGKSAYSTYNLDSELEDHIAATFSGTQTLIPGPDFYQSDHAIFAMQGRPAMAITTELVDEMLETLFHAPTDTRDQLDAGLLVDISDAITKLVTTWPGSLS